MLSCANWRLCYLNLAGITKLVESRYRANDLFSRVGMHVNSICSNLYKLGNDFIIICYRTLITPPPGRTCKFIPLPWYKGGGWNPSPEFLICSSTSKRLYLQRKAFDLLYAMRYILWVVALPGACDVTNNGRHLGRHLGFYQEFEIRLKP